MIKNFRFVVAYRSVLLSLCACLVFCGCGQSSTTSGDKSTSEAEERDDNAFFFCFHVADELYFKNNGYTFEMPNPVELKISNPTTRKSITLDVMDLKKLGETKSAEEVANDLYMRMQQELGEPPQPSPNAPLFMEPLMMGHQNNQKKLYPERWRQWVIQDYKEGLIKAGQLVQDSKRDEAGELIKDDVSLLRRELGKDDPYTIHAMNMYTQCTGKYLHYVDNENGWTLWELSPEEAMERNVTNPPIPPDFSLEGQQPQQNPQNQALLAEADKEIENAAAKWREGDYNGAITHAQRAHAIRSHILGADHPKVAEVQKMLDAARAAQQKQ